MWAPLVGDCLGPNSIQSSAHFVCQLGEPSIIPFVQMASLQHDLIWVACRAFVCIISISEFISMAGIGYTG